MIKLVKLAFLGAVLLTSVVANASKIITTKSAKNKVVNITLTEITEGEVLSISNANGVSLYTETIEVTDAYIKEFDFSTYPSGLYYLKTSKEAKKEGIDVTQILVNDQGVTITPNAVKIFKAPEVKLRDNSILKVLINNPRSLSVNINIYDANGVEIKSNYTEDKIIYRSYNFDNLGKGTYTISVAQGDGYFITEEVTF